MLDITSRMWPIFTRMSAVPDYLPNLSNFFYNPTNIYLNNPILYLFFLGTATINVTKCKAFVTLTSVSGYFRCLEW